MSSKSFMQHQREIDHDAEVELAMERIEQDMREELLDGGYYAIEYRAGWGTKEDVFDRDDVINAMIDLDGDGFNAAVMLATKDPIESAKALASLIEPAVEQVIGLAKIREAAEYMMEMEDAA